MPLCLFFFHNANRKGQECQRHILWINVEYGSYHSCKNNVTLQTNLIMKRYFKSLSCINNAQYLLSFWNQASSVNSVSSGSRRPSFTACKTKYKNTFFFQLQLLVPGWFYMAVGVMLIFLCIVVVETYTCWANCVKDLQGKCSNLTPISSWFSSVGTAFCLV
jgi:hypothetical protein